MSNTDERHAQPPGTRTNSAMPSGPSTSSMRPRSSTGAPPGARTRIPPPDELNWGIWNILAGRGFGKTRVGAETIGNWAVNNPKTRWLVCALTSSDLRSVCFDGESGLLNIIPPELIVDFNKTHFELTVKCRNSDETSLIKGISAEEPKRFRHGAPR